MSHIKEIFFKEIEKMQKIYSTVAVPKPYIAEIRWINLREIAIAHMDQVNQL